MVSCKKSLEPRENGSCPDRDQEAPEEGKEGGWTGHGLRASDPRWCNVWEQLPQCPCPSNLVTRGPE